MEFRNALNHFRLKISYTRVCLQGEREVHFRREAEDVENHKSVVPPVSEQEPETYTFTAFGESIRELRCKATSELNAKE